MERIVVLGSTGSIGRQTLDVVSQEKNKFRVEALACGTNVSLLLEQIEKFRPRLVSVSTPQLAHYIEEEAKKRGLRALEVVWGTAGLITCASLTNVLVVNGLTGMMGLKPTYFALKNGNDVALANKETLVAGGHIIMELAAESKLKIYPIDSEHSAIYQCLMGNDRRRIKRILLTASGGPFRNFTKEQLRGVTLEQALKHPNWSMGPKITVDSATLMNKGLEVMEAGWLFGTGPDDIQVLVHPQSIVHSAVEFVDSAVMAQMGSPDMRMPIALALSRGKRQAVNLKSLDFFRDFQHLTFERPDMETFTCLKMAFDAMRQGGSYPVVLNGANERLVELFLKRKISFIDIQETLEKIMVAHVTQNVDSIEAVYEVDKWAREEVDRIWASAL